jgi:predicted transcriptional regulator
MSGATENALVIAGEFLNRAPVDVEAMAEALGLTVNMNAPMPPNLSGSIRRGGNGRAGYRIEVNGSHSPNRKRFTLAHEIAHFILHRDLIGNGIEDNAMYRSGLSEPVEIEANRMAAQILMPTALVRDVYKAGLRYIGGLSSAFGVSEEAMRIRLEQLRLAP